ncbi:MAG: hypothetical protein FWG87_02300 [Defluviitaleaceae bacterium]|nr:hypothetical protein [Defluviitaleaceae bacterium]
MAIGEIVILSACKHTRDKRIKPKYVNLNTDLTDFHGFTRIRSCKNPLKSA